jgi:DNA polymerase-3 subunit alpha
MSAPAFVHLRLHTEYSLQDSVVRIPELVERAAQLGMPAVAVTDQNNLFAMVKFYREALQQGVKPIVGVDVLLRMRGERAIPARLTLLCKDPGGYQNVTNLITRAWLEGQDRGTPLIERAWLDAENTAGLIALSGAAEGDVGRALLAGREAEALALAREWQQLFGDRYYLELQRLARPDASCGPRISNPTRRASVSPMARSSPTRPGSAGTPRRSTCARRKRCGSCSPTSPRRCRTRWRSRGDARCR